ncbi:MAG: hypothetical protein ACK5G9_04745 [Akkermansiaceae bacterium]
MSKLDPHEKLIIKLYKSEKTAKGTHRRLQENGVSVSLETVRQWLHQHANKLPTLRVGGGKPAESQAKQFFRFLPENADWVPDAYMYPEFFECFIQDSTPPHKDALLAGCLERYGIKARLKTLEFTKFPLKRLRYLSDLDVYLMAYLLGHHGALVGVSLEEFSAETRAITPMAIRLRQIIACRNSITVGKLRELLHG